MWVNYPADAAPPPLSRLGKQGDNELLYVGAMVSGADAVLS